MTRSKTSWFCGLCALAFIASAWAEEARSPEELAAQLASAIASADPNRVAALFHPQSDAETVQNLVERFLAFKGAGQFIVRAIGKEDSLWPQGRLENLLRGLAKGLVFPAEPLGRVSVSGMRPGDTGVCAVGVLYGSFGERYLMMLAATGDKTSLIPPRTGSTAPRC